MDPLTLTAYAKRRGVSVKSVSRAIATGRLVQCVGRDHLRRPTIVDPDLADREWAKNTRQWSEPSADGHRDLKPENMATPRQASPPPSGDMAPEHTQARPAEPPADIPDLNTSRALREAALARRDTAHADMAELELAEKRGELVDAAGARADVENAYSLVRTRLLGVPSQVAQRLPHLAGEVVPVIDALLREALEELST